MSNNSALLNSFPVAAIQLVSGDNPLGNFSSISRLVREAKQGSGSRLVVLPENALCFSAQGYLALAEDSQYYIEQLCQLAREQEVYLVLGSVPLLDDTGSNTNVDRFRSASLLISPQGQVCARYDKLHLFDVDVADNTGAYRESDTFEAGSKVLVKPHTLQGDLAQVTLGLTICYDLRFPELYQSLRIQGANVITAPAAFTYTTGRAHWEVLLRARAIETQCYIIAANQGGTHPSGRQTWGHSMIVSPWGEILAECGEGEGYCSSEIDLDELHRIRNAMPLVAHRKSILSGL